MTPEEIKQAVDELRKVSEKYGNDSHQFKEVQDKTDKAFEESDKKHQEIVASQKEQEKKALELEESIKAGEERIQTLELELAKGGSRKGDYKDTPEYKAITKLIRFGEKNSDHPMTDEDWSAFHKQQKTMRMDDGTAGGYLTTTEMDNQIIKSITEISPMRQVARVKTVSKKTLEIPKRTSIPVATYEGEAAEGDESQSAYGNEQLTAYRLTTTVPYTMDLLGDSEFNLESEIGSDVSEAFAYGEGNAFVLGNGSKKPEGFLANAALAAAPYTSESSGTITGDDILLITGELKIGYNPIYVFNRKTLAFIRTLADTVGQYLWQPSLREGAPNQLAGAGYVVMQDMPDIAANSLSLAYGDFLRGYCITDRTGTVVIRDDYTQKKKAIVELTFHRWNTGQVVLTEAIKLMKTKA